MGNGVIWHLTIVHRLGSHAKLDRDGLSWKEQSRRTEQAEVAFFRSLLEIFRSQTLVYYGFYRSNILARLFDFPNWELPYSARCLPHRGLRMEAFLIMVDRQL